MEKLGGREAFEKLSEQVQKKLSDAGLDLTSLAASLRQDASHAGTSHGPGTDAQWQPTEEEQKYMDSMKDYMFESVAFTLKSVINIAGVPVEDFLAMVRQIYKAGEDTVNKKGIKVKADPKETKALLEGLRKKTLLDEAEWQGLVGAIRQLKEMGHEMVPAAASTEEKKEEGFDIEKVLGLLKDYTPVNMGKFK